MDSHPTIIMTSIMMNNNLGALSREGAPFAVIFDWCNTLGLKKEKSFQRIVLHLCSFKYIKDLINKILSLV